MQVWYGPTRQVARVGEPGWQDVPAATRLLVLTISMRAAGASYEVITDSSGNQVGNFSLTSTPIDPNTNALTLPATFNATQLLRTGTYTAVITYYPTINFTMPIPLTITFSITVRPPLRGQSGTRCSYSGADLNLPCLRATAAHGSVALGCSRSLSQLCGTSSVYSLVPERGLRHSLQHLVSGWGRSQKAKAAHALKLRCSCRTSLCRRRHRPHWSPLRHRRRPCRSRSPRRRHPRCPPPLRRAPAAAPTAPPPSPWRSSTTRCSFLARDRGPGEPVR